MFIASRGTREQQPAVFSGLQNALRNDTIEVDNNGCNNLPLKRRKDETKDDSDIRPPRAKKPHQSLREDLRTATCVERAVSPVTSSRSVPQRTCCVTVSPSSDCWQSPPRVFHRPFETASSFGRSEVDTDADRQSSPAVSICQPNDERHDVVSWADCLRQLATALRRRQVVDDNSQAVIDPAVLPIPTDVGSVDQRTTRSQSQSPPDRKHQHYNCDSEVEQRDELRLINDEDYCSIIRSSNNNNVYVCKSDTTTTEYTRSVDDFHCPLSFNAAAVQADPCRGLYLLISLHTVIYARARTHTHTHNRKCFVLSV